ncbi:MAG: ABC transporter permease [Phycisphaerales bacterium]|nr:ABC transporter permease [Phycisphaerales bacterium]
MSPFAVLAEAFSSLTRNKVRTMLSMLGIIIGVGSVIAMVAVGEGGRQKVERELAALGDDWLMVTYWGIQRGGARRMQGISSTAVVEEAEAIGRDCPAIRAATPTNMARSGQVISSYGNNSSSVLGCYPSYFDIRRWGVTRGQLFTFEDMELRRAVCVIGASAAEELFGSVDPIGQTIRVNKAPFQIIGLLERKGISTRGHDEDDIVIFPWHIFQRKVAGDEVAQTMYAASHPGVPLGVAKAQIRALLRQRHRLLPEDDDDFRLIDRTQQAQVNAETTKTFNSMLMAIASISLIVGGVGIMNIMLVSVTERTREIGLRMAIGANGYHVLGQFLAEAIVLCAVGGALGFAAGGGGAYYLKSNMEYEIAISYWMAGVAVAFAAMVGLFFGFYPAWRASRLNPIDALRFE